VDFAEAERRFYELKGRLDAGLITPAAFEAAARQLTLRDATGRLWTLGVQTGNWYYAAGSTWVQAQPPAESVVRPPSAVSGPASAAPSPAVSNSRRRTTGSGSGKLALPLLAAGCLGALGLLVAGALAAALFLPGSPWRTLPLSPAAELATPSAQQTPDTVTPATVTPTVTPVVIVVTATPLPSTSTPVAPPSATATRSPVPPSPVATATATGAPTGTATPPPTPTSTPTVPAPTATVPPAPPTPPPPLSVTLSNPHYERWGRPTDNTGCFYYNNGSPVRRFTIQVVLKNNTAATISDWAKPSFYSNTGASLARCYGSNPTDTTLPPVPANSTSTVTFSSFTDEGTWVSRVDFTYRDRTWRWTLDTDAQVITGP
jgi:hypothetical protein